jgi:hypothetical protein
MLWDEEEKFEKPSPEIERKKRGEGVFVIVRFRNRDDLSQFADKIGAPHLKLMKIGIPNAFYRYFA